MIDTLWVAILIMKIIKDNDFLKEEHKHFISEFILKADFPYFIQPHSTFDDNYTMMEHICLRRYDKDWNTGNVEIYKDILNTFCKKHDIKYKEILRCSVNLTFNVGIKKSLVHTDHKEPHKQLLIYCNNVKDKRSYTVILDKNRKPIDKIKPIQYSAVSFGDNHHYHYYPKIGHRVVLVYTFI